jgi:asparagine synthase (glutamine-hydrolysing)
MCGIFGWIGRPPDDPEALASSLSRLLRHRGPDDDGLATGPDWGLGFRRLAIIDLGVTGRQPMPTPDGCWQIAFNGEIYNYVELRKDLENRGEVFRGTSDTEVLLRLIALEGPGALQRLNGMFALAAIDLRTRTYLLARDRLGVKPLYLWRGPGHLRFASELKALLAWPGAPREIDPQAIAEYVAAGYLPGETVVFRGYEKVPPAHFIRGSLDDPERGVAEPYWRLDMSDDEGAGAISDRADEDLGELLGDAVRIRLRSDVPVGVFLSGGIDSGLVAAVTGDSGPTDRPIALTVGFPGEDDETSLARETAQSAGLEHLIVPQEAVGLHTVDRMAWFYDEPFGDPSALPTFALCEAASGYGKVFLAGDGGDEAFAGYRRHLQAHRLRWLGRIPELAATVLRESAGLMPPMSLLRHRVEKVSLPDQGFAAFFDHLPNDAILPLVLAPDIRGVVQDAGRPFWIRWGRTRRRPLLTRQLLLEYSLYLPDDILVKVDRASMAHSIEVRSPFLDHRLVEWAARLPRGVLLDQSGGKLPLRRLAAKRLPPAVARGKKRGFGAPVDRWFRESLGQDLVHERLLSRTARERGLWDPRGVELVNRAHLSERGRDFGSLLWHLLMLDAWARWYGSGTEFLHGPPPASAPLR